MSDYAIFLYLKERVTYGDVVPIIGHYIIKKGMSTP